MQFFFLLSYFTKANHILQKGNLEASVTSNNNILLLKSDSRVAGTFHSGSLSDMARLAQSSVLEMKAQQLDLNNVLGREKISSHLLRTQAMKKKLLSHPVPRETRKRLHLFKLLARNNEHALLARYHSAHKREILAALGHLSAPAPQYMCDKLKV